MGLSSCENIVLNLIKRESRGNGGNVQKGYVLKWGVCCVEGKMGKQRIGGVVESG